MSEGFSQHPGDAVERIRNAESFDEIKAALDMPLETPGQHDADTVEVEPLQGVREAEEGLTDYANQTHPSIPEYDHGRVLGISATHEYTDKQHHGANVALAHIEAQVGHMQRATHPEHFASDVERLIEETQSETLDDGQLARYMNLLTRTESLTSGEVKAWRGIEELPEERIQNLVEGDDPAWQELMTMSTNTALNGKQEEYEHFLQFSERALAYKYGSVDQWCQKGEAIIPDYAKPLVEVEKFRDYLFEQALAKAEQEPTTETHDRELRKFEREFLEDYIGLPETLAEEFRLAISARSMRKNERNRTIPYEKGGGIQLGYWREHLEKVAENAAEIGLENVTRLRKELGIVNLDRYEKQDLLNTIKLLDQDPEYLKQLRSGDLTIMAMSALGDHNGSSDTRYERMRRVTRGRFVCVEINQPGDIYRHVISLSEKYGVKAANLIYSTHGSPKGMIFEGAEGRFGYKKTTIATSNFGRFVGKYMVPGRETGKRAILLNSCEQAVDAQPKSKIRRGIRRLFRRPSVEEMSPAEVLARTTRPEDNVAISAVDVKSRTSIDRKSRIVVEDENGKPAGIHEFSRTRYGVRRRQSDYYQLNAADEYTTESAKVA